MQNELIVTEENFDKYFRNIRTKKRQKNDVIAVFQSSAIFQKGKLKEEIVDLLCNEFGSVAKCVGKLFKYAYASQGEAIRLCKEIIKDFTSGVSRDDIVIKEYPFFLQMFFYTKEKYMPKDDARWMVLKDEKRENNNNIMSV